MRNKVSGVAVALFAISPYVRCSSMKGRLE